MGANETFRALVAEPQYMPRAVRRCLAVAFATGLSIVGIVTASASAAPKIAASATVKVGQTFTITATGFRADSALDIVAQLASFSGSNSGGINFGSATTDAAGFAAITVRMPTGYFVCAGVDDCRKRKWNGRTRVDLSVTSRRPYEAAPSRRLVVVP